MARLNLFNNKEDDEEAGKAVEAKFKTIEDTVKAMSDSQAASAKVTESLATSITAMNDRFAREDKARETAQRKAESERQNPSRTSEEEFEAFGNDPKGYIAEQNKNTLRLAAITSAKQLRLEILSDKEYYYGEIKAKVNALLDAETNLQAINNPSFVLNAYKIVVADHMQEIQEGKIKKQTSLHGFSDSSTDGRRSEADDKPKVEYRDQKTAAAAAAFGLTEEDLVKTAKEGSIHGLEVVA